MQTRLRSPGALFLQALLLRALLLGVTLLLGVEQVSDAGWYHDRAVEIASGAGYAIDGVPTAYWPVGWPGLLGALYALFGSAQIVGLVVNVLLGALAAPLTFALARRATGDERTASIAGLLVALHPNHVAYGALLMAEPTALALLLGAMVLLVRDRLAWTGVAGVLMGALVLVKPQYVFLVLLVPAVDRSLRSQPSGGGWHAKRAVWGRLALAAVVAAAVCTPWVLRNAQLYSAAPVLSNNDGVNLWFGNNPRATGAYLSDSVVDRLYTVPGENEYEANIRARRLALDYVAAHPVEALGRVPRKLWYLWRADAEGFTLLSRGLSPDSGAARVVGGMKYIAQGWWLLLLAGCAWSVVQRLRGALPRERWSWLPLLAVAVVSLWGIVWFGDGRFHYPAIPFMAIAIAVWMRNRMVKGRKGRV